MDAHRLVDNVLLALELVLCVTLVGLFGAAYPDNFRSRLWENGGVEGWNSDPNQRIYFYANYREPPEIPLIWSQRLTDSNLAIALLSFLMTAARIVMRANGQLKPTFSMIYDGILCLVWMYSVCSQASADLSDPEHPSRYPWYLTHDCQDSWEATAGACRVSQASFAMSLLAGILYAGRLAVMAARMGIEVVQGWRRHDYQLITDKADYADEEELARERERYLYREALSPVLAFFPEDGR